MVSMQVADELGNERVVWTSNGIAPYSVDDPGVGKAGFEPLLRPARCTVSMDALKRHLQIKQDWHEICALNIRNLSGMWKESVQQS